MTPKKIILALFFLFSTPLPAQEDGIHSLDDIYSTAQLFAYQQTKVDAGDELEISVSPVDSRLKFKQCATPLEGFLPPGVTGPFIRLVGVRCNSPNVWSLFVPIKTSVYSNVLVASKQLIKDQLISENEVMVSRQDKTLLYHGFYTDKAALLGKTAKKTVQAGTLLTPEFIQANQVIKRGDSVTIVAAIGNLTVKSQGRALEDGEIGATIKVKNEQSKRIVDGVVASAGIIKIAL